MAREEFIVTLEERQTRLVEVNQTLHGIRERLRTEASCAYYDLLVLLHDIRKTPLHFDQFPTLEWREFCIHTSRAITDMKAWSDLYMDPAERESANVAYLDRKIRLKREAEEKKRLAAAAIPPNEQPHSLIARAQKAITKIAALFA